MEELKPCPFCGREISIDVRDEEGNLRNEKYLNDPWSGVSFSISHPLLGNLNCPIANHDGEQVGCLLFDSKEKLAECWNHRAAENSEGAGKHPTTPEG